MDGQTDKIAPRPKKILHHKVPEATARQAVEGGEERDGEAQLLRPDPRHRLPRPPRQTKYLFSPENMVAKDHAAEVIVTERI